MLPRTGIHADLPKILYTFACLAAAAWETTRKLRGLPPIPWP